MAKIDIVVGTSTSLLYDLLPYNKPVWLLETPLRIYHDMLDYGFAKSFTKDDFVNLETKFDNSLLEDNKVDPKLLFGDQSISDVIKHNYL